VGVASRSTRHATRTVCRHLLSIYFLPYSRCRVPYYADGSWLKLERRSTHGSTGGDRAVSVTSPEAERAQRHLHCTTAPRAQTGRFCFGSCRARGPPRGDRLGMSARSDGFFIPYRVPYGQRANQVISLRIISKQYTVHPQPARARARPSCDNRARLHLPRARPSCGRPPQRMALPMGATSALRQTKHRKLYREDSRQNSTNRRWRTCAHVMPTLCPRSQRQAAQFHLHYSR
jgi:hypothetical protein